MLTHAKLDEVMKAVASLMEANRQMLIELDQRNGDGDLGISMADGYAAASRFVKSSEEDDLGKLFFGMSKAFNEAAPSSLGTITSLFLMGAAKVLKGSTGADLALLASALREGMNRVMEKAGSKPGEKTILDALDPAISALEDNKQESAAAAFSAAAEAAKLGAQSTAEMLAVHGRAAYYGQRTLGLVDGGAVAGALVFEAIAHAVGKMTETA